MKYFSLHLWSSKQQRILSGELNMRNMLLHPLLRLGGKELMRCDSSTSILNIHIP